MKVYTRTGDDGTTALFGGERVAKTHPRIDAYGTVDETNACLGLARAHLKSMVSLGSTIYQGDGFSDADFAHADSLLDRVQHDLFVLGGDLASPHDTKYPVPRMTLDHTAALEAEIDRLDEDLPPLKHFILPGGSAAAAALHVARTTCRRAERLTVDLAHLEPIAEACPRYLNRLSDLLFTLARWVNHRAGIAEPIWAPVER
ncbi:MAG: cob(I)yrinic acid a,c-diamide adenosyltransferase [Bacteroidota bacterium]